MALPDADSIYEFGLEVSSLFFVKTCIDFAGVSVFLYDYLQTVHDEVTMIWRSRLSLGKVLFIVARYTPFIDLTFFLSMNIPELVHHPSICRILQGIALVSTILGITTCEAILVSSLSALVGVTKRSSTIIWSIFAAHAVVIAVFTGLALDGVRGVPPPWPLKRCYTIYSPADRAHFLARGYLILLVGESIATSIAVVVGIRKYWRTKSRLTNVLYRDGTMYYIGLLTCTIVNLSTHNSAIGIGPLHLLQRAMHAILANRLLLDTRRQFKANYIGPGGSTAVVSDLKFKNTQASRRGQNTTWNEMGTVGLGGGGGDGLQDSEASRSDGQSELGIVEVRRDENESVPV